MIAVLLLACAWPSSAPTPSQPLIVEVAYGTSDSAADTGRMAPADGAPETEAPSPLGSAGSEPGPGEPQAEADPGVGGVP